MPLAPMGPAPRATPSPWPTWPARTFGQTQDATAAQVFEQHPPNCFAGIPGNSFATQTPAVLVTNQSYQDALSSSYLAGNLGTSILTTSQATLSPDALAAMRLTGVTTVYVIGGPDAISRSLVTSSCRIRRRAHLRR